MGVSALFSNEYTGNGFSRWDDDDGEGERVASFVVAVAAYLDWMVQNIENRIKPLTTCGGSRLGSEVR